MDKCWPAVRKGSKVILIKKYNFASIKSSSKLNVKGSTYKLIHSSGTIICVLHCNANNVNEAHCVIY